MEVRVEVRESYWFDNTRARFNVDLILGDEWVSINHVEVVQKDGQARAFGVYVPKRGSGQPALFLSDEVYGKLRRAAIEAFKAGPS